MTRRDKENYYLDIAQTVLERGTCLRRNYGAIIVKNDAIISTGYSGAPRGTHNCCDTGECIREKLGIPRGQRYELCRSVHAEANAIIAASREEMLDASLYLVGRDIAHGRNHGGRDALHDVPQADHQRGHQPRCRARMLYLDVVSHYYQEKVLSYHE